MRQLQAEAEQNARDLPVLSEILHTPPSGKLSAVMESTSAGDILGVCVGFRGVEGAGNDQESMEILASKGIDELCGPNMADRHLLMRSPAP